MKKILYICAVGLFLCCAEAFAEVSFEAGVSVHQEAENAALAKENAMKTAYREAFLKVAERLTSKENVEKLNNLTDDQLIHFIKETDVVAEKSGLNVYMADLNIKIDGELLKAYMLENQMMEIVSKPADILIIPTYADTLYPGKVLFEDGNIWREVLLSKGVIKAGNLTINVIEDNLSNRAFLTAENAFYMSEDVFEKVKLINRAKNIYTVHAVRAGGNNVVLVIKPYNEPEKRIVVTDDEKDPFEKAVQEMVDYIYNMMQQKDAEESSYSSKINVQFSYKKLKDWLDLQKKLNTMPEVKKIETGAMVGGDVSFGIEFSGTLETLKRSLQENGLTLIFENGHYIIQQ